MVAEPQSTTQLLTSLLLIFVAAKVAAELFERAGQPAVVGEILAGVIIGPSMLGWVAPNELLTSLAELGAIFLLFGVGLETMPRALIRASRTALPVALGGVVVPFALCYGLMLALHRGQAESLFVGAAMVATSVGITAQVLGRMRMLRTFAAQTILSAAVMDDVFGLTVLAVVGGIAGGGSTLWQIVATVFLAIGFTTAMATVGSGLVRRAAPRLHDLRIGEAFFVSGIGFCLLLAVVSERIGMAAIVGAFLAGMAFAEPAHGTDMRQRTNALTDFLVPFFLVNIGLQLNLSALSNPGTLALCALLVVLATIGKLLGCGAPLWKSGWRAMGQVGVGMVPRGEVGVIVAQVGLSSGFISESIFAALVSVAVVTTVIAPPFVQRLFQHEVTDDQASPDVDDPPINGLT
jgi:Kef-type K+ transport system membrane component KefB